MLERLLLSGAARFVVRRWPVLLVSALAAAAVALASPAGRCIESAALVGVGLLGFELGRSAR